MRGLGRLLRISTTTVIRRLRLMAARLQPPTLIPNDAYELDEMRAVVGAKRRAIWLCCALSRATGRLVNFIVGRRCLRTLRELIRPLLSRQPSALLTDGLDLYRQLIPPQLHRRQRRCTNRIERHHLTLRTRLKRLGRRTLAFSRSITMLTACVRLAVWA